MTEPRHILRKQLFRQKSLRRSGLDIGGQLRGHPAPEHITAPGRRQARAKKSSRHRGIFRAIRTVPLKSLLKSQTATTVFYSLIPPA
ncbi:MAG: hypothetical protein ACYS74_17335, partial [Planctomycetota bacterium]